MAFDSVEKAFGQMAFLVNQPIDSAPRLFEGIPESALEETLGACPVRTYADGEFLLVPGQENHFVYVLVSGLLKIHRKEQDQAFVYVKPGGCVGEMSIINGRPAGAFVASQGISTLQLIPEEKFWRLLWALPQMVRNLLAILSARIRIDDRIVLKQMEQRIALEKEMDIARQVQESLLTRQFDQFPHKGVDVFASMEPFHAVGGDFYDAFFTGPDRLFVCMGDVMGKGIPAALFMVRSITHVRMEALREDDPAKILRAVNKALCENNSSGMFLTLFCGILDTGTGLFTFASGGHMPPLSDAGGGAFEALPLPEGTLLGLFEDASFENGVASLSPGQSLVLFSDGVTEAADEAGQFFGETRLPSALRDSPSGDARGLVVSLRAELFRFCGPARPCDDVTLLALRYQPAPPGVQALVCG